MQAAQQPSQRLLEVGPLVLVDGLGLGGLHLAHLDLALHLHEPLEVLLQALGQVRQERRQRLAQRREGGGVGRQGEVVVLAAGRVLQPAQQRHLLGHGQLGVELHPGLAHQVPGGAGVVHPAGRDLHPGGLPGTGLGVVGQHDLVGQRSDVDLVGLLVQVVLLGHVLGLEELLDVVGLAVGVAVLGGVAGLLGERELLQLALVGEVLVAVPVTVTDVVLDDRPEPEEAVEDPVEGLQVAPVLDQADRQRGAQHLAVDQDAGLGDGVHGVDGLRGAHADAVEPQQPDEPVDRALHRLRPAACGRSGPRTTATPDPGDALARAGARAALAAVVRRVVATGTVLGGAGPRDRPVRRPRRRRAGCSRRVARAGAVLVVVAVPWPCPWPWPRRRGRWRSGRPSPGSRRIALSRSRSYFTTTLSVRDSTVGGQLLDAEHGQRPGPVDGLGDRGRLAQLEVAQSADDLDEPRRQRLGEPGLLGADDLQLALGLGVVEEQVQAAALQRGREVTGVVRGQHHVGQLLGADRARPRGSRSGTRRAARAAPPRAPRRRGRPRR